MIRDPLPILGGHGMEGNQHLGGWPIFFPGREFSFNNFQRHPVHAPRQGTQPTIGAYL
jgi:hypothetical protein